MGTSAEPDVRWARLVDEHFAQRALDRPKTRPHPSPTGRVVLVLAAVMAAGPGAWCMYVSMAGLRGAHLYRQSSGEGLGFFWVAVVGTTGAILWLTGAGLLLEASRGGSTRQRVILRAAAIVLVVGVLACWSVAGWVERQEGCIGPCG